MKITILSLFLFGITLNTFSQVFYSEDFEGTMNATTNLPTNWTESGLSTDGIWTVGDAAAASSAYISWPVPVTGTNFAYTNDDDCNCNKSNDRITLPVLDFTGMTFVEMNVDIFLNGGYGEQFYCLVSLNGGSTYDTVYTAAGAGNVWTPNVNINLTSYAGSANVTITFAYNDGGNWAYGAGIDNISLSEFAQPFDLTPLNSNREYSSIPETQVDLIDLVLNVYNNSPNDLTDLVVDANISIDGTFDQTLTSPLASVLSGDTVAVLVGSYPVNSSGNYEVEYIVSSASIVETNPSNDTLVDTFMIDPAFYSRDFNLPAFNLGLNGTGNTAVLGSNYDITNFSRMDSINALHGQLTAGDTLIYEVYTTTGGVPATLIGVSDIYIVTAADETAATVSPTVAVSDLSLNPLYLSPGEYFVGYRELSTINNGALGAADDIFTPLKSWGQINGGVWQSIEEIGFISVLMVHAKLATCENFTSSISSVDPQCFGDTTGTATVTASAGAPGYSYFWGVNTGNQTTATATGLGPGTYYVDITDTIGCTIVDTVVINEPAELIAAAADNGDGTATASALGGTAPYSYQWDAAAGNQTTATATNLPSGTYDVVVTDSNGCSSSATVAVINTIGIDEINGGNLFSLQPNPANDFVFVVLNELESNEVQNIQIFDASGKMILSPSLIGSENGTLKIETTNLATGVYTVRIQTNSKTITNRLVIAK